MPFCEVINRLSHILDGQTLVTCVSDKTKSETRKSQTYHDAQSTGDRQSHALSDEGAHYASAEEHYTSVDLQWLPADQINHRQVYTA